MKKDMTQVYECDVSDCAYNKHNSCHTLAITVGGPEDCPHCDTYMVTALAGGIEDVKAGIGACKVSSCTMNQDFECNAESVRIGWHANHPDCRTFRPRTTT
ncbi:DUF1540 domain-containing protein [Geotalea sp. SG265]|uniref:DUF1540 domain-containing protein n=1 Tax=Geotalea sp. SG265 TaxID=2922867 RepID=UPI001FAF9759|nr:DUF1540 domain-containing protein [Geotalea sp. SG265]